MKQCLQSNILFFEMNTYSPDLSLQINLEQTKINDLSSNLSELISASGGQGGILTTWDSDSPDRPQTVTCGIPAQSKENLCA